jgi:hypothetical protein
MSVGLFYRGIMKSNEPLKQAYEKMLNKPLSDQEVEEAAHDLVVFFEILIEIDRDLKLNQKSHESFDN